MNDRKKPRNILHLNLKSQWFNMILSGEKKEEYREQKLYWNRIFYSGLKAICIKDIYYKPEDVIICFSNGYAKNRRQFYIKCNGLKSGFGLEKWGAAKDEVYYVLKLGNIIKTVNCTVSTRRANANP